MQIGTVSRALIGILAATALSGCLGNNGGGAAGGGAGGGGAAFQAEFDRVSGIIPTSDMPARLQGNYEGAVQVKGAGNAAGVMEGDLALAIDWTDGQTRNPFSGTASNFKGTPAGSQTEQDIAGTLNVSTTLPGTIGRTVTTGIPVVGSIATGSMVVHLDGELSTADGAVDTTMQLGGAFLGTGATAATGAAVVGFKAKGAGASPAIFDAGGGGTFYIEKK